jgi:hypothetical protein
MRCCSGIGRWRDIALRKPVGKVAVSQSTAPRIRAVAVGDTRVWIDGYDIKNPVSYTLKAAQICRLNSGRNAVFWRSEWWRNGC